MRKRHDPAVAEILLRVHRHAWRVDAPPLDLTLAELTTILPNLIESGSVGIVWPRLRHRAADYGAAGMALEAAYQAQVEHNQRVEHDIVRVVGQLQDHGIDPVLVKGFAVARLYPEGLIRPAGDIDLVVRDHEYERATQLLAGASLSLHEFGAENPIHDLDAPPLATIELDLHAPAHWEDYPGEALFALSQPIDLDGRKVRVPANEEHLRTLAFHYLRHGGVRFGRLVDIALLAERNLDWERTVGSDPIRANWVLTAAGLAKRLHGAEFTTRPIVEGGLPQWLPPLIERRLPERQVDPAGALGELLAHPSGIWRVLRRRWPDPISATMRMPAAFDTKPRLPIQWAVYLKRLVGWTVWRLPNQARARLGR